MPYEEFLKWHQYFDVKPPGIEEDSRTLKLLQVQGFKGAPEEVFNSFARMKNTRDAMNLRGSVMFKMMGASTGGVSLSELLGGAA